MIALQVMCIVFMVTSAHSGSQTKGATGISQFGTDDFKIFDQVYGKTSDKELYGATLPPSIMFDIPKVKSLASEKKERYLSNIDIPDSVENTYFAGDRYAKLFAKSLYNDKTKPSSALQFISFSDFKPISETSDPETYKYLKNLESRSKYKIEFPEKGIGGFKPYNAGADAEANDAYRSIQDILDAHEANKPKIKENDDEKDVRNNYKEKRKNNDKNVNKNRSKVRNINGNGINTRCNNGSCRKRNTTGVRYSRPYIRKIQRIHYSKR